MRGERVKEVLVFEPLQIIYSEAPAIGFNLIISARVMTFND
jgi:hypothetical protein